ncbi:MAG: leucyl/phenylalanyl-tRNA--protein transferase, partial [Salibacteraceae bacterium]
MRQGNTKSTYAFPPVETADENGLLAYGGDLSPERLISAYESGVFPWFESGQPILWWSPPKRMILEPGEIKLSKSMRQLIASQRFEITVDNAFKDVMDRCSKIPRKDQDSTWITESMIRAYSRLHELGFAHSFETRKNGKLVGGLYGVSLGKIFFGESMFHTESKASKNPFYHFQEFA